MIDRTIQNYFQDAIRNVDIKIFKADLYMKDMSRETHYFTNRFEIGFTGVAGSSSVYDKLEKL